jgi:hypothetical protein
MSSKVIVGVVAAVMAVAAMKAQEPPAGSAQESPAPAAAAMVPDGYAWATGCKDCHQPIFDAWAKTKHARALSSLGSSDREAGSTCVGCHVTGSKGPIEVDGTVVNANVQCESCHGAGQAHIDAAKAGNATAAKLPKSPPERVCVACHNERSPHYRGFFYAALKGLVHKP